MTAHAKHVFKQSGMENEYLFTPKGLRGCTSQSISVLNHLGTYTAVAAFPVSSVTVCDSLVGKTLFTSFLLIMGNRFS